MDSRRETERAAWRAEREACHLRRAEEVLGEEPVGLVGRTGEEKVGEKKMWGLHLCMQVMEDDGKWESKRSHEDDP